MGQPFLFLAMTKIICLCNQHHCFRPAMNGTLHYKIYIVMEPNMSMKEAMTRYAVMVALVITGGLLHNVWIMAAGVPIFLFGLLGWCPIHAALGIDHASEERPE